MARPPAMTTEIGYINPSPSDPSTWSPGSVPDMWWWELTEQVPDLRWPLSLVAYSRMPREDARCWSLLSAIGLPIRRTQWRIDPNGAEDRVVAHIAGDLGLPILGDNGGDKPKPRRRDRFSWKAHLRDTLSCLRYGHSVFEQVYRYDENDGLFHLRKLAPRPQFTISAFNVARDGGLISIVQDEPMNTNRIRAGATSTVIDVSRLVVYRNEPEPGVWIGTSLLRPSYKHWLLKDELMRIEAAAARRNGIGVPVATLNDTDSKGPLAEQRIAEYERIASRFRGGMSAGAALPNGAKLEILGVQGNLPDMRQAIEYHDKQIALAGLAHFLNLDRGGSYALASVQADVFVQSVQSIAEDIADVTNEHVIEDLLDSNYSIDVGAPLLVCDEIGSRQDATAAALNLLVQAGLLDPDDALKAFIRQQLGAPAVDPNYRPAAAPAEPDPAGGPADEPDDAPATPPASNRARQHTSRSLGKMSLSTDQGVLF
ncbi:portal protein [Mycobacterium phage 32HC]|uniref:Portal protein n=1 Tax=Mycobacterium phage 32HC TaxID=1445729 RepID=W8EAD1_9CAUD|nr:portal protein [Mycobacterium phage 32HC]AHJ86288.1 portal protein [Mycobacterium phage 32HC]